MLNRPHNRRNHSDDKMMCPVCKEVYDISYTIEHLGKAHTRSELSYQLFRLLKTRAESKTNG